MNSSSRQLALVMNPTAAAGKALRVLPIAQQELTALGLAHRVIEAHDIGHASHAARAAAAAGEVVVALGGDGLVGALAGALCGRGALGVLPAGRGNDFARALKIPTNTAAACHVLFREKERVVDIGSVNGRPFVCVASTGYDSEANRIANDARLIKGNLVYAYAAIRALASWRPASFVVRLDGVEHRFVGYSVAAANAPYYGGGMRIAPRADLTDGMLDVVLVKQTSKLRFLANLPKVFSAKHVELDGVSVHRAREVEIEADRPFAVYADGDPLAELPAKVTVTGAGLRVIAPQP